MGLFYSKCFAINVKSKEVEQKNRKVGNVPIRPLFVILRGGLGNQLFMFSSALAIAKQSGRKLLIIDSWFKTDQRGPLFRDHTRECEIKKFARVASYQNGFVRILQPIIYLVFKLHWKYGSSATLKVCADVDNPKDAVSLDRAWILHGYMQEPKYFESHRTLLLELFKLETKIEDDIKSLIKSMSKDKNRLIALHVRRGDNASNMQFANVLTANYFKSCLINFDLKQSEILVFSDDIDWCKINFKDFPTNNITYVNESDPVVSLRMMSLCDDFILSPSTFSWWGAWLSIRKDKKVVVPIPYNQESSEIWKQLVGNGWIEMPADFETPS